MTIELARTEDDARAAGAALAAAFADYALMDAFFGEARVFGVGPMMDMVSRARVLSQRPLPLARVGGEVVGAVLLDLPDDPPWPESLDAEWDAFLTTMPDDLTQKFSAYGEMKKQYRTSDRHVFVTGIGVRPDMQGRGIGKALMSEVRRIAGDLPIELDTQVPENVALYERWGFRTRAEAKYEDLTCWFMRQVP